MRRVVYGEGNLPYSQVDTLQLDESSGEKRITWWKADGILSSVRLICKEVRAALQVSFWDSFLLHQIRRNFYHEFWRGYNQTIVYRC